MSPFDRSRKRLEGVNVRQILEASNLPVDLATAISDKCDGLLGPEERPTRDAAFMAWMRQHAPTQLAELITRRESMRPGNDHSQAITEPQSEQP